MAGIKLQKRRDDFFVSYGHADAVRVAPLIDFLKRTCGLSVWFDGTQGNASVRSSKLLSDAIGNARGALFCVSEAWKRSTWCGDEFEVALTQRREYDGFEIVAIQLDDVEPPAWFKVAEIIDMRQPGARAIGRLLKSLGSDPPHRFDNAEDVYFAAPWSRPSPLVRDTQPIVVARSRCERRPMTAQRSRRCSPTSTSCCAMPRMTIPAHSSSSPRRYATIRPRPKTSRR